MRIASSEVFEAEELLEEVESWSEENTELDSAHAGRGGVVHRYWQHRIRDAFEKAGWHSFLEKFDADVYVNMGSTELVVEVAMGDNPREIQHVEKHLDKEFIVWVACRNQEIQEGLEQRMKDQGLDADQVVFRLFRDFKDLEIESGLGVVASRCVGEQGVYLVFRVDEGGHLTVSICRKLSGIISKRRSVL